MGLVGNPRKVTDNNYRVAQLNSEVETKVVEANDLFNWAFCLTKIV